MKNKLIILSLCICSLLAASCGSSDSSSGVSEDGSSSGIVLDRSKLVITPHSMDEITPSFDRLIEQAQIILIGEVVDDGITADNGNSSGNTMNTLKAVKVFKGEELIEDGKVDIYDNYAFIINSEGSGQLLLYTKHAPLYKGDKAIFLLKYNETVQRYIPIGTLGRFPLPEDIGKTDRLGFVNGLIDGVSLNEEYYKKLCEKYDIK